MTFDTYESIKNLKTAGVEERHAEAIVAEFKKLQDSSLAHLAMKEDLMKLELATREGLMKLELKIAEMESDIIKWVFGISAAQAALIVTLLRLLK